jgi:hypothetical protein
MPCAPNCSVQIEISATDLCPSLLRSVDTTRQCHGPLTPMPRYVGGMVCGFVTLPCQASALCRFRHFKMASSTPTATASAPQVDVHQLRLRLLLCGRPRCLIKTLSILPEYLKKGYRVGRRIRLPRLAIRSDAVSVPEALVCLRHYGSKDSVPHSPACRPGAIVRPMGSQR